MAPILSFLSSLRDVIDELFSAYYAPQLQWGLEFQTYKLGAHLKPKVFEVLILKSLLLEWSN